MRKVALLLNGGGFQIHSQRWYQQCMERLHGGLALIRCFQVFTSLHGLENHWNGSQGPPRAML
jgi:hypothetical protein